LTDTDSEIASYEFTTLTCIPGVIYYKEAKIQLLDLPGIIEGASHGKGKGRQVVAVAKSSDLILMILDASKERGAKHRQILEMELNAVGIRLNETPPDVYFKRKNTGGVKFSSTVKLTHLGDNPFKVVKDILNEYRIHNCEILVRQDITVDQFIDVIEGNRKYVKCLYIYNKIDVCTIEFIDKLARRENSVVISCTLNLGLDYLLEKIWDCLELVRIYTKKKGEPPSFNEPLILTTGRGGTTVEEGCKLIHKELIENFKCAWIWGSSTKHNPQRVGLKHMLQDEDVVQVVTKTSVEQKHDKNFGQKVQQYKDNYHEKKKLKKKKNK